MSHLRKRSKTRPMELDLGVTVASREPEGGPVRSYEKTGLRFDQRCVSGNETNGWKLELNTIMASEETDRQKRILELYDLHASSLYKYLRSLGLARVEAEDSIQEIFVRLAIHLLQKEDQDVNLRAWLFQVAHNISMDIHRSNRRMQAKTEPASEMSVEPADPGADPERMYLDKERMRRLNAAIERLTPQQRNAVLLRSQGLRYMEIGSVLAVSESRAIALVKRGLTRLADGL
jgi:RNA polymerase sigma-70 factor (ECF subfamily)